MKIAIGLKSHSGWAALVTIGLTASGHRVVDRRRLPLVEEDSFSARQPYHAAEQLKAEEAGVLVETLVASAGRAAKHQIKTIVQEYGALGRQIDAVAVLTPRAMPAWSTREILAVHFRMHKAEGVLFPDALCRAVNSCGLSLIDIPERQLAEYSELILSVPYEHSMQMILGIGKAVGPPWGRDQKNAALAAVVALQMGGTEIRLFRPPEN